MKIQEQAIPRGHVVIDDFLSPKDLSIVWSEVCRLEPVMDVGTPGTPQNRYLPNKRNRITVLAEDQRVDGKRSSVLKRVRSTLLSTQLVDALHATRTSAFQTLPYCMMSTLQVSSYGNGEYYRGHYDINAPSNITFILFLCREPRPFTGGNLVLMHLGRRKVIPFKNNRALLFPSNTLHEVTPVHMRGDRLADSRISLQIWPHLPLKNVRRVIARQRKPTTEQLRRAVLTPYFSIDPEVWNDAGKFFGIARLKGPSQLPLVDLLMATQNVTSILTSNVQYLAAKWLRNDRATFGAQVRPTRTGSDSTLEIGCTIREKGLSYSFGYLIAQSESATTLRLFVRRMGPARLSVEREAEISPEANIETTLAVLRRLMTGVARAVAVQAPQSRARSLFSPQT